MNELLTTAIELHTAGFSVVPVAADGSKRPRTAWKQYTDTPAPTGQLHDWFTPDIEQGIGVVTGVGGLELLEVEGKGMTLMPDVLELLDGTGARDLYQRVLTGWSEQSPSGGLHLFYRVDGAPVPGNKKIAQRPADEPPGRETLAETRGTGGFVVLAPSSGNVHPTGTPYVRIIGGPATVATITGEERDTLHTIFHAALDTMPATDPQRGSGGPVAPMWAGAAPRAGGDITPGDDYENQTDWADILTGWTLVFTRGHTRYWRRPGKKDGVSATTGHADDRDRLYVFTSSTEFEPETPYTKLGALAVLQFAGDHTAAARHLAGNGYGHRAPRELAPPAAPARATPTGTQLALIAGHTAAAPDNTLVAVDDLDRTDDGNARVLVDAYRAQLGYVPETGKWVTWDDTRWAWHPDDAPAVEAARDIIRRLPDDDQTMRNHKRRSLAARSLSSIVRLARADTGMRIPADRFDRHPAQLNTPGGIVDLRTGDTAAPLPTLHHSKQTRVGPANEPTPLWSQFLATTFQHDTDLERYVQTLVGMSAFGEVREHILPFLHGQGANGKTVFLETLATVLGDYATEAPSGFLLAGRDKHETELANLQGRRLVIASEVNENTRFDEAKMKTLTGGDKITARFMRQDFFTFTPTHTLWLMGNNQPKVETGGHSFWRRLRLIAFTHTVPEHERIEGLQERLVDEEGPGILQWVIDGAVRYHAEGLHTPRTVLAATDAYRAEEDHLGRFVEECCLLGGGDIARIEMAELRQAYDKWCRDENETEISGTAFGRQLKQKFELGTAKSNGRRYYTGIQLATPEDAPPADPRDTTWWDR